MPSRQSDKWKQVFTIEYFAILQRLSFIPGSVIGANLAFSLANE